MRHVWGVTLSVRVAVTRLAEDGLIEIFPQRGTFVAAIKLKLLREAQFARSALEVALAEEAARHRTEQHSVEARLNLDKRARHARTGDSRRFFIDNEAFHQLIARAAKLEAAMKTHLRSVDHATARLQPLHANYFVEE